MAAPRVSVTAPSVHDAFTGENDEVWFNSLAPRAASGATLSEAIAEHGRLIDETLGQSGERQMPALGRGPVDDRDTLAAPRVPARREPIDPEMRAMIEAHEAAIYPLYVD
ncbi:MAG: hypothetical protein FJZ92_10785 [Chloroflexi bacterium]|nr:hypothetical protein [Chloroflexota bacterium]